MIKKSDYDITKLIMMQKLEPRTAALKPAKIAHAGTPGSVNVLVTFTASL